MHGIRKHCKYNAGSGKKEKTTDGCWQQKSVRFNFQSEKGILSHNVRHVK